MIEYPKVIASSVIRSTHQNESHGGVYIVDLEKESFEQVIDWNDNSISWKGRGLDRGLRGIAFWGNHIYLAASDELFVYNKNLDIVKSFKNRYLKHCHEIFCHDDRLFLTSTGFDSILEFDLASDKFVKGHCFRFARYRPTSRVSKENTLPKIYSFDPLKERGPRIGDTLHINNVYCSSGVMYVSGSHLRTLISLETNIVSAYATIPYGSHNARPFKDGVLLNHTKTDCIAYLTRDGKILSYFKIKYYNEADLYNNHLPKDHARQGFGRGLCISKNGLIISGSSPATISVYRFGNVLPEKSVNLTMDVRNSIHGLQIWPF